MKLLVSLIFVIVNLYYILVVNFTLLNVTVINTTSTSVTVRCTTTYTAMGHYCKITINGLTNMLSFNGNTVTVSITGLVLASNTTYTASLVDSSGLPLTDTCITVEDSITTTEPILSTVLTLMSMIPTTSIMTSSVPPTLGKHK